MHIEKYYFHMQFYSRSKAKPSQTKLKSVFDVVRKMENIAFTLTRPSTLQNEMEKKNLLRPNSNRCAWFAHLLPVNWRHRYYNYVNLLFKRLFFYHIFFFSSVFHFSSLARQHTKKKNCGDHFGRNKVSFRFTSNTFISSNFNT